MSGVRAADVTIAITNYNYAEYLDQAIKSALSQTYKMVKVIVVDDASTDNSREIIETYQDRVDTIFHEDNKGIVYSRNEILEVVNSKYLLFLDADDWIDTDYVNSLVSVAEKEKYDVVYCNAQYYIDGEKDIKWIPPKFNIEWLKNENYIHMSSLLKVKSIKDARFDKDMEGLTHEDWDFFLNLALRGLRFGYDSNSALNYRKKSGSRNLTSQHSDDVKFARLYRYLYDKYKSTYPEQIGYLAYYRFAGDLLRYSDKIDIIESNLNSQSHRVHELEQEVNAIKSSRKYKIGNYIAAPFIITKRTIGEVRRVNYSDYISQFILESSLYGKLRDKTYRENNRKSKGEKYFIDTDGLFKRTNDHAVVLHLYYTDNWLDVFESKLTKLQSGGINFDLFITLPEENRFFIEKIKESFNDANILIVPNKGRDVLPFIKTGILLKDLGYQKVLKIHSKKSTHRDSSNYEAESGNQWLVNMMNMLIPESEKSLTELKQVLADDDVAIVGPEQYHFPVKTYLSHNIDSIKRILNSLDYDLFEGDTAAKTDNLSFFGGTMLWVDINSISELLDISESNFHQEKGQTDGTLAHALERVICILPQLKGMKTYTIGEAGLDLSKSNKLEYPSWYNNDISHGRPRISVVVPVYADWYSLSKNIESLLKYYRDADHVSVHYVNDCGPEADALEVKIKEQISGVTNFYYHSNPSNLGFIKSCNRAVSDLIDKSNDVLLLNSDTKVTKNFIEEMRQVMYSDFNIGAVTSRSNNATIWSVPMTSRLANHRTLSYLLYRLIRHTLPQRYITPTIHGFCVLIRRSVIDEHGLFDEIYGRGYGEENDFAMRIRNHGWKCAVANYSFVFHYESRSFGQDARNESIEKNEKILIKRYPEYRQLVQSYWDEIKEPLK